MTNQLKNKPLPELINQLLSIIEMDVAKLQVKCEDRGLTDQEAYQVTNYLKALTIHQKDEKKEAKEQTTDLRSVEVEDLQKMLDNE
jgi:hypothetical protein